MSSLKLQIFLSTALIAVGMLLIVAGSIGLRRAFADEAVALDPASSTSKSRSANAKSTLPVAGKVDPVADSIPEYKKPSVAQLRRKLNRIQYDVTQNEATEPAHSNRYWDNKREGVYECIVCGQDLFSSDTKYKSGTGWPSFYAPLKSSQVATKTDYFLFYPRTEVHCSRCEAHLGHVFDDGPQPTGKRYCMNSASMNFVEAEKDSSASE